MRIYRRDNRADDRWWCRSLQAGRDVVDAVRALRLASRPGSEPSQGGKQRQLRPLAGTGLDHEAEGIATRGYGRPGGSGIAGPLWW